jgi:hypothetical protein
LRTIIKTLHKIFGFRGGQDIDVDLLSCNAAWTCGYIQTFRNKIAPKKEAACSSETLISTTNPHGVTTHKTPISSFNIVFATLEHGQKNYRNSTFL